MARSVDRTLQPQQPWHKAQDWLFATGKLPQKEQEIVQFGRLLIDGVVLCEVANFLHPGAIKTYDARPHKVFMCIGNIDLFLTACKTFFGFPHNEDLFTATELFELENFAKVLEVLERLSQTHQAVVKGLAPFQIVDEDQERYMALPSEAESVIGDIYSRIEDINQFDTTIEEPAFDPTENIYEDIFKIKQFRLGKPQDKRGYLIDEIFETEKNYVQMLETIITHFLEKLRPVLTIDDIRVVFQNIEELRSIHEKLLQRLKRHIDHGGETIGDCFVKTLSMFYKYGPYCAFLDVATAKIDELMQNGKIAPHIMRCQAESLQRFGLKDLIKVPAQRILKYHLLLDNLLKDCPTNHSLQEGLRVMKALASYINEYKRNVEQWLATKAVEERIQNLDGENLFSYGRLLKDGEVQVKKGSKTTKRFAFLFEKCILICKKVESSSNLEIDLPLDFETYTLAEELESTGGKYSYGWVMRSREDLRRMGEQSPKVHTILIKTEELCRNWLRELKEGMNLLVSHTIYPHKFVLADFTTLTLCMMCHEPLSGRFAQGIACTVCGLTCHRQCKLHAQPCKSPRSSKGFKELPPLPGSSQIQTEWDSAESHVSPPPIPPRAPSFKQERRSIPGTPVSGGPTSRSPSIDSGQFTIHGDLYVCTRDYSGARISEIFDPPIPLITGEFVEVLNKNHQIYWKGRTQALGQTGYFPSDHVKMYSGAGLVRSDSRGPVGGGMSGQALYNYPWYVGEMDRHGGRMMLEPVTVPDGCYLVRESKNRVGQFSIDVKFNLMVKHIKVVYSEDARTFFLTPSKTFPSIVDLVTHYQRCTLGAVFRDLQTKLLVPYRCLPGS